MWSLALPTKSLNCTTQYLGKYPQWSLISFNWIWGGSFQQLELLDCMWRGRAAYEDRNGFSPKFECDRSNCQELRWTQNPIENFNTYQECGPGKSLGSCITQRFWVKDSEKQTCSCFKLDSLLSPHPLLLSRNGIQQLAILIIIQGKFEKLILHKMSLFIKFINNSPYKTKQINQMYPRIGVCLLDIILQPEVLPSILRWLVWQDKHELEKLHPLWAWQVF